MTGGIGLCGSHRTGKTTLAGEIAAATGRVFVRTTTSDVFAANGLDPAEPMDFVTRLWIQDKVVECAEQIWQAAPPRFISDRTPIDMMAYTLADIRGETRVDFVALESYMDRCFEATNRYFDELVVVQPAIPLVLEQGKAALNRAYMEHLNLLILGLCADERQRCRVKIIPRRVIDLAARAREIAGISG